MSGVRESRVRKPVWMSFARSVPAFMVENIAPCMNANASAKSRKELVGKPGRRVAACRPPVFTESRMRGKATAGIALAGCRKVRTTDRRASQ